MKITEKEFRAYESVRSAGVTNMFMISTVSELSGLTKEKITAIMKGYSELKESFEVTSK